MNNTLKPTPQPPQHQSGPFMGPPNNVKDMNSFLEHMPEKMPFSIVEDHPNLIRDDATNAIINMDVTEYNNYKSLKKIKDKEYERVQSLENEMTNIKDDLSEIKSLLKNLLSSNGN